jgi:hypothetical protein
MGQGQSKNDSEKSETINWNKIKTENVSSSIPNFNGLSSDAQNLIASLNIPQITESQTSEFTVNHILDKISNNLNQDDQNKFNQLLEQVSSQTAVENELSDTSPFISSEMYNYLVKNNEPQKGGGSRKIKSIQGGSKLDEDSDTSTTSSDSSDEDLVDSTEEEVIKKKNMKNMKKNKHNKHKKSDSELSGGELSYLSSSAHTEGEYSNSHTGKQSSSKSSSKSSSESSTTKISEKLSNESSSETQSSVKQSSATDHNGMQSTSISVNTEDINMVSDY